MIMICSMIHMHPTSICIWSSWCHCHPKTPPSLSHLNPDWFYLFSRTTCVSWYQKGKTRLDLKEARDDGVLGSSRIISQHKKNINLPANLWNGRYKYEWYETQSPVELKYTDSFTKAVHCNFHYTAVLQWKQNTQWLAVCYHPQLQSLPPAVVRTGIYICVSIYMLVR